MTNRYLTPNEFIKNSENMQISLLYIAPYIGGGGGRSISRKNSTFKCYGFVGEGQRYSCFWELGKGFDFSVKVEYINLKHPINIK